MAFFTPPNGYLPLLVISMRSSVSCGGRTNMSKQQSERVRRSYGAETGRGEALEMQRNLIVNFCSS